MTGNSYYIPSINALNSPFKITLIDSKGVKYTFGGTNESIGFTRPGFSPQDDAMMNSYLVKNSIAASEWNLTSIESPSGAKIVFNYERGACFLTYDYALDNKVIIANSTGNPVNSPVLSATMFNPSYLVSISSPLEDIELSYSNKNMASAYDVSTTHYFSSAQFYGIDNVKLRNTVLDANFARINFSTYPDVRLSSAIYKDLIVKKLNKFVVKNKAGEVLKNQVFSFIENSQERLKLKSVETIYPSGITSQKWTFEYNPKKLPNYLTFQSDIYGFYNGINNLDIVTDPSYYFNSFQNETFLGQYLAKRSINTEFCQAEILTKVTYPTQGYTSFFYEGNDYRKKLSSDVQGIEALPINYPGPGVRVKKIEDFDFDNVKIGVREYFYSRASVGQSNENISSGVLTYSPLFYEKYEGNIGASHSYRFNNPSIPVNYSQSIKYIKYGSDPIYKNRNEDGDLLTYSEVSVEENGKGKISTVFKNYDNGYADRLPLNEAYDHKGVSSEWKGDMLSSMSLERGKKIKETVLDKAGKIKQITRYSYFDDPKRFLDNGLNIRKLKIFSNATMDFKIGNGISLRYLATLQYNYFPYLKEKTTVMFFGADSLLATTRFTYNSNRNVSEELSENSAGYSRTVSRYSGDFTFNSEPADIFSKDVKMLNQKHMLSKLLEQSTFKGTEVSTMALVSTNLYRYNPTNGQTKQMDFIEVEHPISNFNILSADIGKTKLIYDPKYKKKMEISSFDSFGNPTEIIENDGFRTAFVWGYEGQYPIAQIENVAYSTVLDALGGSSVLQQLNQHSPIKSFIDLKMSALQNSLGGSMLNYSIYKYGYGLLKSVGRNGLATNYEYDEAGRLKSEKDDKGNIVRTYCYGLRGEAIDCNVILPVGGNSDTVFARLFLSDIVNSPAPYGQRKTGNLKIKFTSDRDGLYPVAVEGMKVMYRGHTKRIDPYGKPVGIENDHIDSVSVTGSEFILIDDFAISYLPSSNAPNNNDPSAPINPYFSQNYSLAINNVPSLWDLMWEVDESFLASHNLKYQPIYEVFSE